MTEQERRNIETAERFVPECYTPYCKVYATGLPRLKAQSSFCRRERRPCRCPKTPHATRRHAGRRG